MELELAGIHRGKEILPQPGVDEGEGTDGKDKKQDEKDGAVRDGELQQAEIKTAQLLEPALESHLGANQRIPALLSALHLCRIVLLKEVLGHGRDHGAGKKVRGQHGKDHRFGKRYKEIPGHTREKEHGHKDDANG